MKAQVKSTAKSIVEEAKEKGRAALYRVSEFLGIKKRLLDIRENVRGAIKTTDKDIAKTALLAKGFREAGQTQQPMHFVLLLISRRWIIHRKSRNIPLQRRCLLL